MPLFKSPGYATACGRGVSVEDLLSGVIISVNLFDGAVLLRPFCRGRFDEAVLSQAVLMGVSNFDILVILVLLFKS